QSHHDQEHLHKH
nr:immunoglobulin heavy chain junction region [Homo sapiens]